MFERLSIPTPFQVGRVNAYLAGHTLVDPGPQSPEAWSALLDELEARGLTPGDVERVLVTHPHPDHFGLAHRLRKAGARVLASGPAADIVGDFAGRLAEEQAYFRPLFERHGLAAETAKTVTELPELFVEYAPDVETDQVLEPDDEVAVGDTTLTTEPAAGHATGELVFAYPGEDGEVAVVGDQVLGHVTPNPFLQPPGPDGERTASVPAFNGSLERIRDRGFDRLLPGHGDPIDDPRARVEEILQANEDRTAAVADLVDGPTTAADVMQGLFGDLPVTETFPGMSEAVGHLELLERRGQVTSEERGGVIVYESA